jgi:hypothetical protein
MIILIEDNNIKLGKHLRNLGIRYGEPFMVTHSNGDGKYIAHSCSMARNYHPEYMIDLFCFYGSKTPNEYDNTLQLYDPDGSKYNSSTHITRSPVWISSAADRERVDQFLFKIRDCILSGTLKVVPVSTGRRSNFLGKLLSLSIWNKDKLGKQIKV